MAKVKVVNVKRFAAAAKKLRENEVEKLDLLKVNNAVMRVVASTKGSWPLTVQTVPHAFIVLQGQITFDVAPVRGGKPLMDKVEKHVLRTGDAIVIPPNVAHGGSVQRRQRALAAEMTFQPMRTIASRRG